jgi:hypothetical protein
LRRDGSRAAAQKLGIFPRIFRMLLTLTDKKDQFRRISGLAPIAQPVMALSAIPARV